MTKIQHQQHCEAVILAHVFFNDIKKVSAWMRAENLNFGGATPEKLIQLGRGKKLIKWMETQIDENKSIGLVGTEKG
jgi:hypothetical protein